MTSRWRRGTFNDEAKATFGRSQLALLDNHRASARACAQSRPPAAPRPGPEDDTTCPICMVAYSDPVAAGCNPGHVFCRECLTLCITANVPEDTALDESTTCVGR